MKDTIRAYVVSKTIAFVPHPRARGLWICTHPAVVLVHCSYVTCCAKRGEPCRNKSGDYQTSTHYVRRADAKKVILKLDPIALKIEYDVAVRNVTDCRQCSQPNRKQATNVKHV